MARLYLMLDRDVTTWLRFIVPLVIGLVVSWPTARRYSFLAAG